MRQTLFLFLILAVGWNICGLADTGTKHKFSMEYKAPQLTGQSSLGWMGGLSYQTYIGPFSLGPVAYFGSPTGGDIKNDNLSIVGLTLNADGYFLGRTFVFRVGVYGAYALGNLNSAASSPPFTGWIVEPSVSVGIVLGKGWRISAGPGYMYCPMNTNFTGATFNLQLERKTFDQTKEAL